MLDQAQNFINITEDIKKGKNMDIQKVLEFAIEKHKGQVDKLGNPYIFHPIGVSLQMQTKEEKIVALLHDILEDTNTTIEELKELGLSEEIIKALQLLTRDKNITYMEYIEKLSSNELAKSVKIQDLKNNMDMSRGFSEETIKLKETRYKKAYEYLINNNGGQ